MIDEARNSGNEGRRDDVKYEFPAPAVTKPSPPTGLRPVDKRPAPCRKLLPPSFLYKYINCSLDFGSSFPKFGFGTGSG